MKFTLITIVTLLLINININAQKGTNMKSDKTNPLLCNPETGFCEIPGAQKENITEDNISKDKSVKIIYFTDPICSACWGIEPQLRKLKLEYGNYIEIDYRMGGLLPDWSYNSGGISGPQDVAKHWEDASKCYQMPISGDVWLEDPLSSSFPPSIAFKAAQIQDTEKAIAFMRKLRELLFIEKKNITKWEMIELAAISAKLDINILKKEIENEAKLAFTEDLTLCRKMGVRGFPTLFFIAENDKQSVIYEVRPYEDFETSILKIIPEAKKEKLDNASEETIFNYFPTLTTKEYALLNNISYNEANTLLEKMVIEEKLEKKAINTGAIYTRKN